MYYAAAYARDRKAANIVSTPICMFDGDIDCKSYESIGISRSKLIEDIIEEV